MGSVPKVIVGLGACAMLLTTVAAVAGQDHRDAASNARVDTRTAAGGGAGGRVASQRNKGVAAAPESKGTPPSSSPAARPSDPSPSSAAVDAVSASPAATNAAAPSSVPSGLSKDAPEHAPSVGVIGRGHSKGRSSPAATPEPTTLLLMGAGLAGLYGIRRRKTRIR